MSRAENKREEKGKEVRRTRNEKKRLGRRDEMMEGKEGKGEENNGGRRRMEVKRSRGWKESVRETERKTEERIQKRVKERGRRINGNKLGEVRRKRRGV